MTIHKVTPMGTARRQFIAMGAALTLGGALVGCSPLPSRPYEPQAGIWQGRISITIEETDKPQSYTAGFLLKGSHSQGTLEVYNPVGSTIAQLSWSGHTAQLYDGSKVTYAQSLHELLAQVFGTPLPTDALFAWLGGHPAQAQGWQVNLTRYPQGRIEATRETPLPRARMKIALSSN